MKPDGFLVMHGALEQTFYTVGKHEFYSFKLSKEAIIESLQNAGFGDIVFDTLNYKEKLPVCDSAGEFYVYGIKKIPKK